ncbi:MAG: CotH kinase family protein [Treponema sp.]|jgi:hypothetical protein|nr:CotH kinase family protein [Treponema sp.]
MKHNRFFAGIFFAALAFGILCAGCDITTDPDTKEAGKLLILQAYGTGDKTDGAVSHSFVELYNNTDSPVDLTGYSLQYSEGGTEWEALDLSGETIPAKSSFLILGAPTNTAPRLDLAGKADITWADKIFSNKTFKVCVVKNTTAFTVANPFNTDGDGTTAAGYTDMFGSADNDSKDLEAGDPKKLAIDGYETEFPFLLSKQKAARRISLVDTDNNAADFEGIDYRAPDKGVTDEELALYRPRNSAAGTWNPVVVKDPAAPEEPANDLPSYVTLTGLPVVALDIVKESVTNTETWIVGKGYQLFDTAGELLLSGTTDIKGRGNSTWTSFNKKPFALKLNSKKSILGMPSHKRWNLLANHSDKSLLRTEIAFKMGEIFDRLAWTPRSQAVDLYMNGVYQGLYQLTEAIKLDENRVSVGDEIAADNPGGGYVIEVDQRKGELFNFTTTKKVVFSCSDPDEALDTVIEETSKTVWQKVQADVQAAENALYAANFAGPEGYRKYFDVDSIVDWYLVNEITKNHDANFYSSVYVYYKPDAGKYFFGPLWDFDMAFGNINYDTCDTAEGFWIKAAPASSNPWPWLPGWGLGAAAQGAVWINRFFEDPAFVDAVKARWNAKKAEVEALYVSGGFIDTRAAYLNGGAQQKNFQKWDILKANTPVWSFEAPLSSSGGYFPVNTYPATYQEAVNKVKNWFSSRVIWFASAINAL